MKKIIALFLIILLVSACNKNEKKETSQMSTIPVYSNFPTLPYSDFQKLTKKELPESLDPLTNNASKIYFYEIIDLLVTVELGVDLGNKEGNSSPKSSTLGYYPPDYIISDTEVNELRSILERSHSNEWNDEYLYGDPEILDLMGGEGYNWALYIEYADGTASYKYGKGTIAKEIQPEGYDILVSGFKDFADSKN